MTDILSHWKRCKLGDVIRLKNGYAFKSQDYAEEGVPLVRISDINDNKVSVESSVRIPKEKVNPSFFVEPGDLLIAMSGATTGKTGVYYGHAPVLQNQRVGNFKIIAETVVDKKWRNYYVASLRKEIEKAAYGGAQPNISSKGIEAFDFPLAPLDEQKSIVAEIEKQFSRLDEAVANLKRIKANLKRYKAAVLKAAVEGKLTEAWRKAHPDVEPASKLLERILTERRTKWKGKGKYKEPVVPDTSILPPLPEGWAWASIDQAVEDSLIGLDRGRAQQTDSPQGGVPYIKMNNVTMDGRVVFRDLAYVPASEGERDRFWLRDGDLLFNTRNSKELVGKVGLVRNPPLGASYNNNLMRMRVSKGMVSAFVCAQMCSAGFRGRMELVKKATTNVAAMYAKDLFPLAIALPSTVEQEQIVAEVERRLSVIEELETTIEANLTRAHRFRQSILGQAFTGQLSSETGPNPSKALFAV